MSVGNGWGVTPAGFVLPSVQDLIQATNGDLLALVPPDTDVSPDQPLGQLIGVCCKKFGELWQLGQVCYNATNRADAEDDLLDNIGSLTDTVREGPSPSTVQCTATFSAAGTYVANSLVANVDGQPSVQFSNAGDIVVPSTGGDGVNPIGANNTWPSLSGSGGTLTLSGGTMVLSTTGYSGTLPASLVGQYVTIAKSSIPQNNSPQNGVAFQISAVSGSSIEWVALAGQATDAANAGEIVWVANPITFLFESADTGEDDGDALVAANSAAAQAMGAGAPSPFYGQLSQMTPVAGWASVADAGAVTIGTSEEDDTDYRVRQYQDLSAPGSDTMDATAAAILEGLQNAPQPPSVATVQMYENTLWTQDPVTGLPPKSYMAVVYDGPNPNTTQNNPLIAQAIWNNHPAGIADVALGSGAVFNVPAVDSLGNQRLVNLTRATAQTVVMGLTLVMPVGTSPAACNAAAAAAAVAIQNASQGQPFTMYGATVTPVRGSATWLVPGQDVIANVFRAVAQGQPGVMDVQPTGATIITSPAPDANGNLAIVIGTYAELQVTVSTTIFNPAAP